MFIASIKIQQRCLVLTKQPSTHKMNMCTNWEYAHYTKFSVVPFPALPIACLVYTTVLPCRGTWVNRRQHFKEFLKGVHHQRQDPLYP